MSIHSRPQPSQTEGSLGRLGTSAALASAKANARRAKGWATRPNLLIFAMHVAEDLARDKPMSRKHKAQSAACIFSTGC